VIAVPTDNTRKSTTFRMTITTNSTKFTMDSMAISTDSMAVTVKDKLSSTVKVEPTDIAESLCSGCGFVIHEKFILKVGEACWHSHCLRCSTCDMELHFDTSCFVREDKVFCKTDYTRLYGTRCSKCCHLITQSDWIRRAGDQVFHLACFACDSCTRQLSTGEEFGLLENRLLCKSHYLEVWETGGCGEDTDGDSCGSTDTPSKKRKSKRNRTTFADEQIHVLQANFQLDCNPDGQDLERIAEISGLSKRVVQVWFQNARARNKKYINKSRGTCHPSNLSTENTLDINIAFSTFYSQTEDDPHNSPHRCFTQPPQV